MRGPPARRKLAGEPTAQPFGVSLVAWLAWPVTVVYM